MTTADDRPDFTETAEEVLALQETPAEEDDVLAHDVAPIAVTATSISQC